MISRSLTISSFLWIILMLSACAPQGPKVDLQAEEQAVRAVSMQWLELEKAKDAAAIAALFADDGIAFMRNQEPVVGQAAIQASMASFFAENQEFTINWTTDRVIIAASGDLAVEYGTWNESSTSPAGIKEDKGKYVTVYRKIEGIWKVSADIGVSTNPVAESTTTAQ